MNVDNFPSLYTQRERGEEVFLPSSTGRGAGDEGLRAESILPIGVTGEASDIQRQKPRIGWVPALSPHPSSLPKEEGA